MKAVDRLSVLSRHLSAKNDQKLNLNNVAGVYTYDHPQFHYTLPNNVLTDAQRQFYDDNGFLVIEKLIPDELLDKCSQRFVDICDGKISRGNMILMKDISLSKTSAKGEHLYNKIQDISFDEVFSEYMTYPALLDIVECFTGPNIMAVHSMLINKPPDVGTLSSRHPVHQDLYYFPFRPAKRIVAAWTAMQRITEENGCLFALPGTHKGVLHRHDYPEWEGNVNKLYHGVRGFDSHPVVNLRMNKGDTVFFHPLLIHGSGPNLTKGFRKAISFHYAASECEYIDVKGTVQENIAKEVLEIGKTRGMELDYCMVWKLKSRLARGSVINL